MTNYSLMTQNEFDEILRELVEDMTASELLSYGEIYTCLSEELNNEILNEWAERNEEKAYGEDFMEEQEQ